MGEPGDTKHFEQILEYLQQARGFDFTAYKRAMLMRRVLKRMQTVDIPTFEAYLDYLQVRPEEFPALFDTILINVTGFFRDPDVWEYLATTLLPSMLESHTDGPIRVWSAGCATGQEPYTLLMLLAEQLGIDALRERVKVYGTDADAAALATARAGAYSSRQVEDVPEPLRSKYFEPGPAESFIVSRELRRSAIFGRHDLIQDAPISRVDLLMCRNTLMYLNAEAQARVLGRFYFSLTPGASLILGRSEMLFSHAAVFTPVDLKRRIFRPVARPSNRDRLLLLAQTGRDLTMPPPPTNSRLRDAAFESDGIPQIVTDADGALVSANMLARQEFSLSRRDFGRPVQELELYYRPAEVRPLLDTAYEQHVAAAARNVSWVTGNTTRYVDVVVTPLLDEDRTVLGARISFQDVTAIRALQAEVQHARQEVETAYEELQSTNEELETTNEELQSTVEELETTNEELQSTNEELETMNEELQSTNEELQTMNDELRLRSLDLNQAHAFLHSVFASLRAAVVVLDRNLRILEWNDRAMDLWGVRIDEVRGANFLGLDIGLPVGELESTIGEVLSGTTEQQEVTLSATTRRGRATACRVSLAPLRQPDRNVIGVILLMNEAASVTP